MRVAIRKTIRETEEERTRRAYQKEPDTEAGDDWSNPEEWKPRSWLSKWLNRAREKL